MLGYISRCYTQSHVSSPHRLPHTCLSQMREKYSFQNKSFLFSKTYYQVSVKFIGQPSETNMLNNPSKQFMGPFNVNCWTISQHNSPKNLPSKFLSQYVPFYFLSCHALTPNILGCPSAYGMHYANPNNSC